MKVAAYNNLPYMTIIMSVKDKKASHEVKIQKTVIIINIFQIHQLLPDFLQLPSFSLRIPYNALLLNT